ncbi:MULTISPECIES: SunI/YnzG family protein [Bacillus cereus group]|uniref:SunI/YnzG family protein n=1 Tax=Bacillus cereus group TaxID=86661 RepID=UPI00159B8EDB|nr:MULTISPECIES: hypothetical protein [Bacillus cereus group]MBJ8109467.1 hypothetical protein [Bacillus cereus group sp. N6]
MEGFYIALSIHVKKLLITWKLATIQIQLSEIIEVTEDKLYADVKKGEVNLIGKVELSIICFQ